MDTMASNSHEWTDIGFGSRNDSRENRGNRGRLEDEMNRNAMVALQGQVIEMNKLLQSMTLSQVNIQACQQVNEMGCVGCEAPHNTDACALNSIKMTPTLIRTTRGGEIIHILAKGSRAKCSAATRWPRKL
ncbi:hypothetical protein E5676_scaffold2119G00470 [Cucumis melo var. makuwa]|uniref:Uncharacterized protein n=1 Tax=Cucumis melo var. makuwa TaxID=1194695 RepID=A0A5A7VLN9_CUCMM|nr:hypothetical protein E6C27_scaffold979G00980 [Cucumis melo var. makuwa]TYK04109.1 hypothetical protein E5676_scaffold2119G00470 [Cucumis melo var. makuwa]